MKRWPIYIFVLTLLLFSPGRGTDIAQLAPVEVVWLGEKMGMVYLQTDTGDCGWGKDAQMALRHMKATTPGTVFLETADYLIVQQGREELLLQMIDVLRPSCKVRIAKNIPDMETVAEFLSAQEPQQTLRQYQVEREELLMLSEQEGRFEWLAE